MSEPKTELQNELAPRTPPALPAVIPGNGPASGNGKMRHEKLQAEAAEPYRTDLDRLVRSSLVRTIYGRSPISLALASADWLGHLAVAPGLQQHLAGLAAERLTELGRYAISCALEGPDAQEGCIKPLPQDQRFSDPAWKKWPFNIIHQSFLMQEDWWQKATTIVPGVTPHNAQIVNFMARQILDLSAPSNFIATNPVVLEKTFETGGRNLLNGYLNFLDDTHRAISQDPPAGAEAYRVGETLACTPGSVVYRNELIELIQYKPTTERVYPEPILIVPAWIMKYYILDLSQQNSLVKHLVDSGHTVFMISWRNPQPEHHDLGMDDYLAMGIKEAMSAVQTIVPDQPMHAVGYCLGGTLLSIAAAAMGRRNGKMIKSLTLLAAQTDFSEAGELTLFIDESEITFLEDLMWGRGLLEARQMAGAFHLLRSNDLIWSRLVRDYLLGGRTPVSDLMAWNADPTHMPYRMHSEYLRRLFLNNDLAAGRYVAEGVPVSLSNIDKPMFVVATAWDHVAPWKSVYKIHLQTNVDITFVLTTGGHNAGIVNPPEGSKREYRIGTHRSTDPYLSPEYWLENHRPVKGSWWTAWFDWLKQHSSAQVAPPAIGATTRGIVPLGDAPGTYVFDR